MREQIFSSTPNRMSLERLESFRSLQRLAYDSVVTTHARLQPGTTEKQACSMVKEFLADHGITEYFHEPFAWFGDRTAFAGFRTPFDFLPTQRRLEEGVPAILDVAPMKSEITVDIGYSFCLGTNSELSAMLGALETYRADILAGVRARKTLRAIYRDLDRRLEHDGYENRHHAYPAHVLGHRVDVPLRISNSRTVFQFGVGAVVGLVRELGKSALGSRSHPLWNGSKQADYLPAESLWAVEPHIGRGNIGAKFEELLVVTESDAFWLDDDVPHVRRGNAWIAS